MKKKFTAVVLSFVMAFVAAFAGNLASVNATSASGMPATVSNNGVGSVSVDLDFSSGTVNGLVVSFTVNEEIVTATFPNTVVFSGNNATVADDIEIQLSENFNPSTMTVHVSEASGFSLELNVDPETKKTSLASKPADKNYPNGSALKFEIVATSGGDTDAHLDVANNEDVYMFWKGAAGINYHKFTTSTSASVADIQTGGPDIGEFYFNKVNADTITSNNNAGDKYSDVFGSRIYWVPDSIFSDPTDGWNNQSSRLHDLFTEGVLQESDLHELTLNPGISENAAGSIVNTPDFSFRIAIITTDYLAIKAPTVMYQECPFNDGIFNMPEIDISGGTESNPTPFRVYLEEPSVTLEGTEAITNLEVQGTASRGIEVQDLSGGKYSLIFKSNYYDSAVVKITIDGNDYFIKVVRTALDAHDNFGPGQTDSTVTMSYTYLNSSNYTDFKVLATLTYANGTRELKVANSVQVEDPMNPGNYLGWELTEGALKTAAYQVDVSGDIVGVYFTVVSSANDITDASQSTFSGTESGSGMGVYYNITTREVEY